MLLCNREESRPLEVAAKFVLKPITWAFPTSISVPTSTVAQAMIYRTISPTNESFELLDNKLIHRLGAPAVGGEKVK